MPLSAVINDGYNRQIVLLRQIVTTNINNSSKNVSESYQIRTQCIILPNWFQFLIKILNIANLLFTSLQSAFRQ